MAYIKKRMSRWKLNLLGRLISGSIRTFAVTWRVKFIGREYIDDLTKKRRPFILVFWHGDMLMGWYFHRNRHYCSLVSMSKDGDLLSELLNLWRYEVIRGSSSKGGKEARKHMEQIVREGRTLVITPDGPQGPPYEMKMGALRTAQLTGVPLVSVTFTVENAVRLKSWDQFTVPLPLSKIIVRYQAPEIIDPELTGSALNDARESFQKGMNPGVVGA